MKYLMLMLCCIGSLSASSTSCKVRKGNSSSRFCAAFVKGFRKGMEDSRRHQRELELLEKEREIQLEILEYEKRSQIEILQYQRSQIEAFQHRRRMSNKEAEVQMMIDEYMERLN